MNPPFFLSVFQLLASYQFYLVLLEFFSCYCGESLCIYLTAKWLSLVIISKPGYRCFHVFLSIFNSLRYSVPVRSANSLYLLQANKSPCTRSNQKLPHPSCVSLINSPPSIPDLFSLTTIQHVAFPFPSLSSLIQTRTSCSSREEGTVLDAS